MRSALVVLATLIAFYSLARVSHDDSWTADDGATCDTYRVGPHELDVCRDRGEQ